QLQLNAFEPVIAHSVLSSLSLLANGVQTFTDRCVIGIEARPDACARHVEASVGSVTALVPLIGYERAADMAKEALATGRTIRELARAALGMSDEELDLMLNPAVLATHAPGFRTG